MMRCIGTGTFQPRIFRLKQKLEVHYFSFSSFFFCLFWIVRLTPVMSLHLFHITSKQNYNYMLFYPPALNNAVCTAVWRFHVCPYVAIPWIVLLYLLQNYLHLAESLEFIICTASVLISSVNSLSVCQYFIFSQFERGFSILLSIYRLLIYAYCFWPKMYIFRRYIKLFSILFLVEYKAYTLNTLILLSLFHKALLFTSSFCLYACVTSA